MNRENINSVIFCRGVFSSPNINEDFKRRISDNFNVKNDIAIKDKEINKSDTVEEIFNELSKKEKELSEAKIRIKELEEIAFKDPLTKIHNRAFIENYCKENQKQEKIIKPSLVIFADGNGLGAFNKKYGYDMGDKYLVLMSEIIKSAVRTINSDEENDIVARWGGDEFVVIIKDTTVFSENIGEEICERIEQKIEEYNDNFREINGWDVEFAIGYFEGNGNIKETINRASKKMQESKDIGKSIKDRINIKDLA